MNEAYLNGKRFRLDPASAIGKGGEAEVYLIDPQTALKIFKRPEHPDYDGQPEAQNAAKERIAEHQRKLREFPRGLPSRVIAPQALAMSRDGKNVVGYAMPFVGGGVELMSYGRRPTRRGATQTAVADIMRDLHGVVEGVHRSSVVIGDFNDLNVIVRASECYLIDADSMQFGPYLCRVYTEKFVDPLMCDASAARLNLVRPYTANSDWYAFAVQLMQCLLFVDPYGGIYRPKNGRKVAHERRPLERITVFNSEVQYPKPAIPFGTLPDDLLQRFHLMFEKDARGEFPKHLIENLRWTTCTSCGLEHARNICPTCAKTAPDLVVHKVTVRGKVTATMFKRTNGHILHATVQDGHLRYLVHEDDAYRREDMSEVVQGPHDPQLRCRIRNRTTILAKDHQLAILEPGCKPRTVPCDTFAGVPQLATSGDNLYWMQNGELMRDEAIAPERVGTMIAGQTILWSGPAFGLGMYRAGGLTIGFIFAPDMRGVNDMIQVPRIRGKLVQASCVFTAERAWLFIASAEAGKTVHRALVVRKDGTNEGNAEAVRGDGSWLGSIGGAVASGAHLFVPTDDGIVRVECVNGNLVQTRDFPDTEPFVDAECRLLVSPDGIYVVQQDRITLLRLS